MGNDQDTSEDLLDHLSKTVSDERVFPGNATEGNMSETPLAGFEIRCGTRLASWRTPGSTTRGTVMLHMPL